MLPRCEPGSGATPSLRGCRHAQPAFGTSHPQVEASISFARAEIGCFTAEQRRRSSIFELAYAAEQRCRQPDQARALKRAMDDESRVSFDIAAVIRVVVNAVAIQGERRKSEQCDGVERESPRTEFILGSDGRIRRLRSAPGCFAVNKVLRFTQCDPPGLAKLVLEFNECKRSGSSRFARYVFDRSEFFRDFAKQKRSFASVSPACPHAARQTEVRNEIAFQRMSVKARPIRTRRFPEVYVVPEIWKRIAGFRGIALAVQSEMERGGARGIQPILRRF